MGILKKVSFSSEVRKQLIPSGEEEDRKGIWMQMAVDRERFKRRILQIEKMLEPVLVKKHEKYMLNSSVDNKVDEDQRSA